ncbi:MAG TPA: TIGR02302 family protein [Stellaceae bacterium]
MADRTQPLGPLFAAKLRLASAALWWEEVWPALWPAAAILALLAVLGLFDLLPRLPGLAHAAILLALGAAFLILAGVGLRGLAAIDRIAASRRIEQASGLLHRPLQALADQPGVPLDVPSTRLWEAHKRRMGAMVRHLRVGMPRAGLAGRDPWGLRAVLAILLVIGAIDAGDEWRDRLLRAVTPSLSAGAPVVAASLDIWVTPPEYTGLPPQFLRTGMAETVHIPTGSKLIAQVHGPGSAPLLSIDGRTGKFEAADKEDFQVSTMLTRGSRLEISQDGAVLGSWSIAIVPDHPPTVAFVKPPEATARKALALNFQAADDYGVEDVKAVITRAGDKSGAALALDLPLPGVHLKSAHAVSYHDLTPHPWAGLPVEIRLVASDALHQKGESEAVRMTLPERVFKDPVARAIIDQRKELAKNPNSRLAVAEILGDLRSRPQLYRNDAVVFLALRVAQEELRQSGDPQAIAEVERLLWDTALRIEDGQTPLAERELRQLERQLQDALAKNAPDAEIDRLMSQLQQALDRYLQALAQKAMTNPNRPEQQPVDPSQMLTSRDLQQMLNRARELARSGNRDQARQLLSQLQNMLENMRMATPGEMSQQSRAAQQAQQALHGMNDLMKRQQQLLDRSFRAEQQAREDTLDQLGQLGQPARPGPGQPGGRADMNDAAGQQEAVRHSLGRLMQQLGEGFGDIPDPLGRADQAMRNATGALRAGRPGAAISPQTDALDQLQQAARSFAKQMQQRLGGAWGRPADERAGTQGRGGPADRDPLGRPLANGGNYDESDVKIPDAGGLQRARQILDELRRRAGERDRPEIERDYIDRLLKQF